MKKRQKLGQHFLTSEIVAKKIVSHVKITKKDVVLEIGTGKGILLPYLCKNAKKVISIEADKSLFDYVTSKFSNFSNLSLKNGDGFKIQDDFSIFVSNLPYSKSRDAMEWLIQKKFLRAIVMVQEEFAQKILSKSGKERKAISVLVNHAADVDIVIKVKKTNFSPAPKVDSTVLKLTQKQKLSKELITTVNKIFSYRRKNIQNIAKQFGKSVKSEKKLDDLSGDEIIKLAKQFIKK